MGKLVSYILRGRLWALLIMMVLLSGCAETKYVFNYANDSERELLWPKGEEKVHYRYVGQLLGEKNFTPQSEGGFQEALVNSLKWIAGIFSSKERNPIVLQRPQSGFSTEDRVYVTDVSRQAIYVFDLQAQKLRVWIDSGTTGGFISPVGVVELSNGQVLVSDSELAAIIRLNQDGTPLGFFAAGIMGRPTGLAYDAQKDWLYIADSSSHDIKVFESTGVFVKTIGGPGNAEGRFNGPTHLSFKNDQLYVSDSLNSRIQVFSADGEFIKTFGERGLYVGNMPRPKGVATDSDGNVYVVESYYDHLLVFNSDGEFLMPLGGTGYGIGEFYLPAGVWSDDADRIYVADMFNGRVVIFQYLGHEGEYRLPPSSKLESTASK